MLEGTNPALNGKVRGFQIEGSPSKQLLSLEQCLCVLEVEKERQTRIARAY